MPYCSAKAYTLACNMRCGVCKSGCCDAIERLSQIESKLSDGVIVFIEGLRVEVKSVMKGEVIGELIGLAMGDIAELIIEGPFAAAVASKGSSTNARLSFCGGSCR